MDFYIVRESLKLFKEHISRPLNIYSFFTLMITGYMILRTFGIDLVPPVLDKVGMIKSNSIGIDINGNYIYQSFALDSLHKNYTHGGYCKIEQSVDAYGVKWVLSGFRTWRKLDKKPREDFMFPWSTDWGGIFEGKKIRFTYNIIIAGGQKIRGYCEGDIQCDKHGKVEQILCNFNQLPPADPIFGSMIIKRVDKEIVDRADVYAIVPINSD